MWRLLILALSNPASSTHYKLFNIGRKPHFYPTTATTITTTTTAATAKATDVPPSAVATHATAARNVTATNAPSNGTDSAGSSLENIVDSSAADYTIISPSDVTMCPSEPVSRIGSITVTTQLDFLTLVINAFSSRVDEYYESQIQFLKHINKLIKATIEIAEECVINRRRWMYKSCVKGITTKVKQASRQSIVEYEKLRKEAVWFAKHGVCSLDDMPSDVISALRQISVDAIMSELTAAGVEHLLIDCEKYCYTDPVVKNIIKKMDSWKTERGNSYQLGNIVARTDEERLHKNHSQHQLGKKSPFISKSWS